MSYRTIKNNKKTKNATVKNEPEKQKQDLITFIIIADIPVYRMKSYGPVSLIEIKEKKLIDYQIEAIKKNYKKYEIIICVGFESNKVAKYIKNNYNRENIRIVENTRYNDTNSCESLRLALNNTLNDKIFIIDGNLIFSEKILKLENSKDNIIYTINNSKDFDIGININENKHVEFLAFGAKYGWSEILFLANTSTIDNLNKILYNDIFKRKFIFEALNVLIDINNDSFIAINKNEIWKINKIKGIK